MASGMEIMAENLMGREIGSSEARRTGILPIPCVGTPCDGRPGILFFPSIGTPSDGRPGILPVPEVFTTTEHWAAEIRKFADAEKSNTLDLARTIWSAKKTLLRGQWSELWRSSGRLPFAKRKGEMFALIGERLGNLNAHTCAQLPAGWTILHQLARLPRPVLEKLIADGDVHPALKLGAAKALVAKFVHGKKHGARPYQLTRRLRDFKKFILSSAEEWTDREQRMVCKTLEELARQLTAPAFSAGFSLSHEPIVWTTTLDATLTT